MNQLKISALFLFTLAQSLPMANAQAPYQLWDQNAPAPTVANTPDLPKVQHIKLHKAIKGEYQFLHGASIIEHKGTFYTSWANSPQNENLEFETLRGNRSTDGGKTWNQLEFIGPGFSGEDRRSHGVFLSHKGQLWNFCSRFGVGDKAMFPGLKTEAFLLSEDSGAWESQGLVAHDNWPMDDPKRLPEGGWIMGGLDRHFRSAVAICKDNDFLHWRTIKIPQPKGKRYSETSVLVDGAEAIAVIRNPHTPFAAISVSKDNGQTWSVATKSNYPMVASQPYAGKLSTGQRFIASNLRNRDTLIISVSKPSEKLLSRAWKIRHGKSKQPLYKGRAKSPQWSYPYAHEHDGKLYVVYSAGKEDADLSIIPLCALEVK